MTDYVLTPEADADLNNIADFVRQQGRAVANRVVDQLERAMRRLSEMPGMGHVRDDLGDDTLSVWPVYSYLIIYRADTQPLQVVRVLHGARDIAALMSS